MSSLAATQADGYYIPPSYYASGAYKKRSISQHAGSKGHNQFLTRSVARFELPYDGFCTNCDAIVGKGTRFNAHKAHVADYFSSKIYEFTTKCRACANCEFKIRTNPKDQSFDYVSGIRKKVEEFDSAEAGTLGVIDTDAGTGIYQYEKGKLLGADGKSEDAPLHALEKTARGERLAMTEHEQMESLYKLNTRMNEDADANALLRSSYRKERKAKKRRFEDAKKMGLGLGISLVGQTEEDVANAKVTIGLRDYEREKYEAHCSEKEKLSGIRSGGIFTSSTQKQGKKPQRSRSHRNRTKHSTKTGTAKSSIEDEIKEKKRIVLYPPHINGETQIEVKAIKHESCSSAISALAEYGSDSD